MVTKKEVVRAIYSGTAIFMVLFTGITIESVWYQTMLGYLTVMDAVWIFVLEIGVMVALFMVLHFVLKQLFGPDILNADRTNDVALESLYFWVKREYQLSPINRLDRRSDIFKLVMERIETYLPEDKKK